jgi:hypothetical protein
MRKNGKRLSKEDVAQQLAHQGEFVLDQTNGAKRLRIKNPWSGGYAPIELFEPVLVAAQGGSLRWRGFERISDQGLVQEWLVRFA